MEAALRNVLEPIFENDFAESSYGFRPGRGCRAAVGRVEELLSQGHVWCVDCDLKSYFDTIPHDRLMALIQQRIVDGIREIAQRLPLGSWKSLNNELYLAGKAAEHRA